MYWEIPVGFLGVAAGENLEEVCGKKKILHVSSDYWLIVNINHDWWIPKNDNC